MADSGELFSNVASKNFLEFEFNSNSYSNQLTSAIQKTGAVCAVKAQIRELNGIKVMWLMHDFGFMGGSLGCAEGERIVLGIEKAMEENMPVVIVCRSGGARMQEGTLALMQLAKVSVAVSALKEKGIPYIAVNQDPTYGGVSASYAMQGDVRIGIKNARIGFAGPAVILNTMFQMDQVAYDQNCPAGFQSAEYLMQHGQLDIVLEEESELDDCVTRILRVLWPSGALPELKGALDTTVDNSEPDYQKSRGLTRFQAQDIIEQVFSDFVELRGDGKVGFDNTIRGGIARLEGRPCVVLGTYKGHNPMDMKASNFGMASPHGYRLALRLMELAEQFKIPVFTLVDTVGAYPSFSSEENGQSEALATNLLRMSKLKVPIISLIVGEGGSGGALGIAMGNRVAMMSKAYYAVISPEGAASILGRYKDDAHKAKQFPLDCKLLAAAQKVYASNLKTLGVIDTIVAEQEGETYDSCPVTMGRIRSYFVEALASLSTMEPSTLVAERYSKFRAMGKFGNMGPEDVQAIVQAKSADGTRKSKPKPAPPKESKTLNFIAEVTLNGPHSAFRGRAPTNILKPTRLVPPAKHDGPLPENAKTILDRDGPEAVTAWVKAQKKVLITDTSMRDAHQSLCATRVRTHDLMMAAEEASVVLRDAFSLEMWGGATFDVAHRFLNEDPWDRLVRLRKAVPNICFQMLLRGSNAVGYTSYPDNLVVEFIKKACEKGIDVFRIFDCFNDLEQMRLSIKTVRECRKIAEVCICFTGNFLSPDEKIYTLDYFKKCAKEATEAGAHLIAIKDMAGLLKPQMARPLLDAIRSVTDLPIHYHGHATSSCTLATTLNLAHAGCDIIDFATASMSDTTSQPSLNAFLASMEGEERDPGINYLSLERYDLLWASIRSVYAPFESGLKAGSARVFEHQIPGGQYSNLFAQCTAMGMMERWGEVLDMYRDVNLLFGDVIKVTPSSKCVGDLALFLLTNGMKASEVVSRGKEIDFPDSTVSLMMGMLGTPHHGLPQDLRDAVLKGKAVMKGRPGDTLPPADFDAEKKRLEEKYLVSLSDTEIVSALLYPKVFEDFLAWKAKFGEKVQHLPSHVFFYGLTIGEEVTLEIPGSEPASIKLTRVGPLQDKGIRTLGFLVNGEKREAKVKDAAVATSTCDLPAADAADPRQLGAPMPGAIEGVFVEEKASVKRGDKILLVAAMKMEVLVKAPYDGVVEKIMVKVGDKVDQGTLVVKMETKKADVGSVDATDSLASGLSELAK